MPLCSFTLFHSDDMPPRDKYLDNMKDMQMTPMIQMQQQQQRRQTIVPANAAVLGAPGEAPGEELTVQQQQNIQNMMDCGLTLTGQPMQGTAIQGVSAVNAAGAGVGGGPGPTPIAPAGGGQPEHCRKNLQKMLGISPSDIDKYSRIFFPVSFICFNLMYWIIYLHVSDEVAPDLVMLNG